MTIVRTIVNLDMLLLFCNTVQNINPYHVHDEISSHIDRDNIVEVQQHARNSLAKELARIDNSIAALQQKV